MVENGIKLGEIVSQAAIRATTHAIQSGSGNFTNRKKKEEGSMTASESRGVQIGMNIPYGQVQQEQYNSPQHYYLSQYAVLNTQAYVRPPSRQQWGGLPHKFLAHNNKISRSHTIHVPRQVIRENKVKKKILPQLGNRIRVCY